MSLSLSSMTAPRQSGLKKPKPLRSMSVNTMVNTSTTSDKSGLLTPLVLDSSECQASASVISQPSPVCREIAAMSALLVAEAGQRTTPPTIVQRQQSYPGGVKPHTTTGTASITTQRAISQPGSVVLPVYARTNSTPSGELEFSQATPRPQVQRRFSMEEVPHTLPVMNEVLPACPADTISKSCILGNQRRVDRSVPGNTGISPDGTRHVTQQTLPVNKPAPVPKENQSQSGKQNLSYLDSGIVVATLKTAKGDEFVLSAESIQTIICVTKVLVSELGAKIEKLEAFPKQEQVIPSGTPTVLNPNEASPELMPGTRTRSHRHAEVNNVFSRLDAPPTCSSNGKYSKDQLLQLSRSLLSRQPPSSWRLLSQAHPEICLPASKVREFFDPLDYCPCDGRIVVESHSVKNNRDN